jgi:hypothetical protein
MKTVAIVAAAWLGLYVVLGVAAFVIRFVELRRLRRGERHVLEVKQWWGLQ